MSRLSWGNCTQCKNYSSLIELECLRCRLKVSKKWESEEYSQKVLRKLEKKDKLRSTSLKKQKKRVKELDRERLEIEKNKVIVYNRILSFMQDSPKPVTLEQISQSVECHKKTAYRELSKMSFKRDLEIFSRCTYNLETHKKGVKLYWIKPFYVFHRTTIKVIEYLLSKEDYSAVTPEIMKEVGVSDVTIYNRYLELQTVGNFLIRLPQSGNGGGRQPYIYKLVENPLDYKGIRNDLVFDQY